MAGGDRRKLGQVDRGLGLMRRFVNVMATPPVAPDGARPRGRARSSWWSHAAVCSHHAAAGDGCSWRVPVVFGRVRVRAILQVTAQVRRLAMRHPALDPQPGCNSHQCTTSRAVLSEVISSRPA
jgi:hypothetical protein